MAITDKKQVNIENVFCCGSSYVASALNSIKNCFWKDVFKALAEFQQQLDVDWDESNPYQTPILYNKNLLIGGNSFFLQVMVRERNFLHS